ncbi:hypothetical protein A2U01_0014474 [Trifolium medium]|uniref:Uncharacterized protein n=1 Tax=Trifolium medium TaxID=97028 RepID=A0A392N1S3_9FABA|nr:hypothetical protein [Trifolium medium]
MESIIDQIARAVQKRQNSAKRLESQKLAQTALFEKANNAQNKAEALAAARREPDAGIKECNDDITRWEKEIADLKALIINRELLIHEAKEKRQRLEELAAAANQEAKKGIAYFSAYEEIEAVIASLVDDINVLDIEIALHKDRCQAFKNTA